VKPRLLTTRFLVPAVLLAGLLARPTCADDPLPFDWVAQASGQVLTLPVLSRALVRRNRQSLLEPGSQASTVLRQMIEEVVVQQEAASLGIQATPQDVDQRYAEIDRQVRAKYGGRQTLREVVYGDMHSNMAEFRAGLRHLLLKERIAGNPKYLGASLPADENRRLAQVQVVVTELLKKAKVEYGVPSAFQEKPVDLGPGGIVRVNGLVVDAESYGLQLALRLPVADVRTVIDQECKAVLTREMALSEQEMEAAIEQERASWLKYRSMSSQEVLKTLSYDDWVKARWNVTLEDLRKDSFFRGLFGLIRTFQAKVTDAEVQKEYEDNKDKLYGPAIRVMDVSIAFLQENELIKSATARKRKDALKAANDILVQKESGIPFDEIARTVNAKQDRTFMANPRRIRNTDDDRVLWDNAVGMKDGDVRVVETISEVHVVRRVAGEPAPKFEDVQALIREGIAHRRSEEWLSERLKDEKVVKVRWPLPEEVWARALQGR
jgi:hypothetical protein